MRVIICVAALFVVSAAVVPASAASQAVWDQCKDVNNKDAVVASLSACNKILEDPGEGRNRAMALRNRCGILYTSGEFDRALADCNKAAEMDPQSAIAFDRRGLIWFKKGELDRAIADFDQALRLNPKYAYAFYGRALALRQKGDTARADADKAEAIRLDPSLAD